MKNFKILYGKIYAFQIFLIFVTRTITFSEHSNLTKGFLHDYNISIKATVIYYAYFCQKTSVPFHPKQNRIN